MFLKFPLSDVNVSVWCDNWSKDSGADSVEKPTPELKQKWRQEQLNLSKQLILKNDFEWDLNTQGTKCIKYIGGVDISFVKDSKVDACATVIICEYPSLNVVWETYSMVTLTLPYVPGFLAFREVPFIMDILQRLQKEQPKYMPQLLMIDGNGILHMRGVGQACHLGILCGIPSLGVAKKLLYADNISDDTVTKAFKLSKDKTTSVELVGDSGVKRAVAMKIRHKKGTATVYISPGHKIDLATSVSVVKACLCGNELPEPVYQADKLSREFLRLNYEDL